MLVKCRDSWPDSDKSELFRTLATLNINIDGWHDCVDKEVEDRFQLDGAAAKIWRKHLNGARPCDWNQWIEDAPPMPRRPPTYLELPDRLDIEEANVCAIDLRQRLQISLS